MALPVEQRDCAALPPGTVVCLGAFDGMHLGHQALLRHAKARGQRVGLVTFDPHPLQVLAPDRAPQLLQTAEQRRRVCAAMGVDHLVLLPFDQPLAQMSAEQFAERILVQGLAPAAVVVGEDFRFGRGRAGDGARLATWLAPAGIEVIRVPPVPVPEGVRRATTSPGTKLGATAVREAVAAGEVDRAGEMLGRWHSVSGTVVTGARRGRTIGFPTANIHAPGAALPPAGVYATVLAVWNTTGACAGAVWPAVANLGHNPTFNPADPQHATPLRLEAHVLDQDLGEQLYGREVELSFVARLRDERRFDGPEALVAQIERDVAQARPILGPNALTRIIAPPTP